jgi:hypothetical protein
MPDFPINPIMRRLQALFTPSGTPAGEPRRLRQARAAFPSALT